jgi:hypothetical protein
MFKSPFDKVHVCLLREYSSISKHILLIFMYFQRIFQKKCLLSLSDKTRPSICHVCIGRFYPHVHFLWQTCITTIGLRGPWTNYPRENRTWFSLKWDNPVILRLYSIFEGRNCFPSETKLITFTLVGAKWSWLEDRKMNWISRKKLEWN